MSASRTPEGILRRLEWTVIRRLDGLLHGDYRTLFRGYGLDLADLREYQYQDDVRHIDWNVTARLQTPYVREYHEDREVSAWFLVDLSGSVGFGSASNLPDALAESKRTSATRARFFPASLIRVGLPRSTPRRERASSSGAAGGFSVGAISRVFAPLVAS